MASETQAPCPNIEDHTPGPEGYIGWHAWAEGMAKHYRQRKCAGCNRYAIWEPKHASPTAKGPGHG
jgi:hypothetical protein